MVAWTGKPAYNRSVIPLRDVNPPGRTPVVTYVLIAINVAVFGYEVSLGSHLDKFIYTWGLVPARFVPATVLTSMFLHGGLLHVVGNMWFLHIFGDNVEDRMGPALYLPFYLVAGAVACVAQVVMNPDSTMPMVGASGAIAGVTGAYMVYYPRARVRTLVPLVFVLYTMDIPAGVFLAFWFFLQLQGGCATYGADGGGVAFWAHVGGFLVGALAAAVIRGRDRAWRDAYAS